LIAAKATLVWIFEIDLHLQVARRGSWVSAAATLALCLCAVHASAITMKDDLSGYTNGPVVGQGGWQAHSGAGAKAVQVNTGTIRLEQSTGSGEDVNKRWFVPRPANATTYASFHLKVQPGSVIGTTPDYFAHFRAAPPDTNSFVTRVFNGPGSNGSHFALGIGGNVVIFWPVALTMGNTYRIVTSYEAMTGASQLWVDPATEASLSITTGADAPASGRQLESYAFRQASPAGTTSFQTINDIVVGTLSEVTGSVGVPFLGTWSLIALALGLALITSTWMRLRHRAVQI
jgi:hypothetical protein